MTDYRKVNKAELIERLERLQSEDTTDADNAELQHLRQDLDVHQVELEMQNYELREKQLELEIAHNKYVDLYDFAPVGYLTFDEKGIIREINLTATGLLKRPRGQLLNKPFTAFFTNGSSQAFHHCLKEAIDTEQEQGVELELIRKDYPTLYVHMQMLASSTSKGHMNIRAALVDITDKKRVEQELLQAKEQAEEASRAKSQFLSCMSHELRTPLHAILGFAQILDINRNNTLDQTDKNAVKEILNGGWHLLEIVNDLLDMSAIEANKVELNIEAVELARHFQEGLDAIRPLARQREINLSSTVKACADIYVRADPVRLKQVLLNLLSNALKYNCQKGSVSLSCEEVGADTVRIVVADTGRGIAEEDLPRLFEPFSRLYLRTHDVEEGTGIGLTIAKQLVERMGGHLGVESKVGEGSRFWIELPRSHGPGQDLPATSSAAVSTAGREVEKKTVLYIEDSPSHIHLVETLVKGMPDLQLLTAPTPELGLELAQAHRPDLIVLDICLPGMSGFEILQTLRASAATSEIPVIAVSANAMPADIEKGLQAGFQRYLTKPLNIGEFSEALDALLQAGDD
ncbi:ATP-binding protein [Sulfuriflexus sp.]|uniref:PAS domain-containing hybrid sensor histidine kinase/response regulator n=1 Tax=Sulfuriflexus sp. TaxID=2015443 RepID=UPI0028CEA356|nr:ATP-binding protein [Sulfuriflexus sp.]MDT8404251.1 ATP-binding protein [Sulfuriflexus sp.]